MDVFHSFVPNAAASGRKEFIELKVDYYIQEKNKPPNPRSRGSSHQALELDDIRKDTGAE
ncbi:hypothetical protein RRH01S_05_04360 [Rhizobium rhizogenes NBRC 13257]|uniref:Uncharacterized protein n=1 Tax=Rhizobium rhizogenes NBRC 13257 TaxID=1220581 RepID=A0AA87Q0T5_RHIRH|nr:hypothetical protein DXT98_09240 [Agrobacterium sp. ICMP 7243]KEA08906.1 hypothetical protein CN09_24890 [Rhizobium rhizogenes]OCJ15718.1 hypothetical protein A6U88_14660 [Agrobacterium sp. B131/95]OCJ19550.1 hypothetical protein A6U89_16380 [Agrobacterium sp. B133/95]GAJ93361.1 hypothetical protein RRH01S_05_04360 [Rhizobium rhizogenes NBRC 13257]